MFTKLVIGENDFGLKIVFTCQNCIIYHFWFLFFLNFSDSCLHDNNINLSELFAKWMRALIPEMRNHKTLVRLAKFKETLWKIPTQHSKLTISNRKLLLQQRIMISVTKLAEKINIGKRKNDMIPKRTNFIVHAVSTQIKFVGYNYELRLIFKMNNFSNRHICSCDQRIELFSTLVATRASISGFRICNSIGRLQFYSKPALCCWIRWCSAAMLGNW